MTARGDATRARLIAATHQVVRDHGYSGATTKAIAEAAGVSEGTIYRHFPDKVALFFEAVLARDQTIIDEVGELPGRAGTATVAHNLARTLTRLADLRDEIIPLELAIRADPAMAERRRHLRPPEPDDDAPPVVIARYLAAEQGLGRVRSDLDPFDAAIALLAMLFGLAMMPEPVGEELGADHIRSAVELVTRGLEP